MSSMHRGDPPGIAVIGCGNISQHHFAGWQRLTEARQARLVAACDNELARAKTAAETCGAPVAPDDFEAVVRRPDVQAVDICLPHHLHLPAILAAARAGKHILCEKPLVLNLEEGVEAVRACREAGVVLMTA